MTYHSSQGQVFCVRCKKPMSEWRASDFCKGDSRGHVGPSSPPSNFIDEGYLYQCDGCGYATEEFEEDLHHKPCSKCETGIMQRVNLDPGPPPDTEAFEI